MINERVTANKNTGNAALAARLQALLDEYQPTQFAAVYDDESGEWVLSYPSGCASGAKGVPA